MAGENRRQESENRAGDVPAKILVGAELWSAVSPTRDFRKAEWNSAPLPEPESEKYTVDVPLPETGFKACYVDLIYRTDDGRQYKISTRIFMTDPGKLL